jgi:site-specific DNA recombinase
VGGTPPDTSPEAEVKDGFISLYGKYERIKIAQRMRAGKLHRARSRPLGGYVSLGYMYVPDVIGGRPAHYEIIPDEAELVRRIFRMYNSGLGVWKIAKVLTGERIPTKMDRLNTRTVKKQRPVGVWSKSSVHKILRNESYASGILYWNKDEAIEPIPGRRRKEKDPRHPKTAKRRRDQGEWLPIAIPPIIDPETFAAAQTQIVKNAAANPRRRIHEYLFLKGRLRCGDCGFAMGGFMSRGKYRRYECQSHNDNLGEHCRKSVSADALEAMVWETIEANLLEEPENLQRYIDLKLRDAQHRQDEVLHLKRRIARIATELESIATQQEKLLKLHLRGEVKEELYLKTKTSLDQTHEQLETLRSELQSRIDVENLRQSQVECAICFVRRLVENLPRASIAERRLVIEALDMHVVFRHLEHNGMRIFFDLPCTDDEEAQWLQEFRWRGLESLSAIDWGEGLLVTSSG